MSAFLCGIIKSEQRPRRTKPEEAEPPFCHTWSPISQRKTLNYLSLPLKTSDQYRPLVHWLGHFIPFFNGYLLSRRYGHWKTMLGSYTVISKNWGLRMLHTGGGKTVNSNSPTLKPTVSQLACLQGKLETKWRIIAHSQQDVAVFICFLFLSISKASQKAKCGMILRGVMLRPKSVLFPNTGLILKIQTTAPCALHWYLPLIYRPA